MKASTRRAKKLATVGDWLRKARPDFEGVIVAQGWRPEFSLLIAVEQLVEYCKLLEAELATNRKDPRE